MLIDELREIRRKKVSMVFQSFALYSYKTILENTGWFGDSRCQQEERQKAAEKALENSGLLTFKDNIQILSGGMHQRVGFSTGLSNDQKVC